ncbi:toxin-antitoxin system YwqK family antitoxin [Formosa sp. S-31]|uniref:toxin-antitoxin system YwqK family antitoxin n=1 Tax=Formosa sp. S-31 TaxID=2790949 RepID=UPI003EBB804E
MKASVLYVFAFLMTVVSFAQEKRELKLNKEAQLIEVTYYHDNGVVSQTGAYTLDGKLEGEWKSYDLEGKKTASAEYKAGKKVGKWFYWDNDVLREVDYSNNAIASVNEWTNKTRVAVNN